VTAYLEALNSHQHGVARAALAPRERRRDRRSLDDPLTNTRSISHIVVSRVSEHRLRAVVDVQYDLQQYQPQSMSNGRTGLQYVLRRAGVGAPWRISSLGS
jgi:hypothetical protein